jgi:hypothetical protein
MLEFWSSVQRDCHSAYRAEEHGSSPTPGDVLAALIAIAAGLDNVALERLDDRDYLIEGTAKVEVVRHLTPRVDAVRFLLALLLDIDIIVVS